MSADSTPTGSPQMTPSSSIYTPSDLSFSQASFLDAPTPAMSDLGHQEHNHDHDHGNLQHADTESLTGTETDDEAEQEWQESLQQLNLLVSLVVLPFFGKWVGRRCAYWGEFVSELNEAYERIREDTKSTG